MKCINKIDECLSYLFVGPSGVGKTYLAKSFGEEIFKKDTLKITVSKKPVTTTIESKKDITTQTGNTSSVKTDEKTEER